MKLVFLGPPGAGKGTQALIISKHFNISSFSTGDIFRAVSQQNDPLALKIKSLMAQGELISDELVVDLVFSKLDSSVQQKGFILDGFPRTINQAEHLERFLAMNASHLDFVINIKVDQNILFDRIQSRVNQSSGNVRLDDNAEVLRSRIDVYNSETKPLIQFYEQRGLLVNIDGMQSVDCVTKDIISSLNKQK